MIDHRGFAVSDYERAKAFYAKALAPLGYSLIMEVTQQQTGSFPAAGRDNGPPGIRAHYHPDYYGAFVLDPDGHNIEAVCHMPA